MPRAQRDLIDLYQWIDARSSDAALIWYRGLKEAIRSLQDNFQRCPATPENKDLRHLLYGNRPNICRVIYRVEERQKQVGILHIRHAARQEFKTIDLKWPKRDTVPFKASSGLLTAALSVAPNRRPGQS